jgi:hypothetical protein
MKLKGIKKKKGRNTSHIKIVLPVSYSMGKPVMRSDKRVMHEQYVSKNVGCR